MASGPRTKNKAAQSLARKRWESGPTPAHSEAARENGKLGGRPPLKDRCPCGAMTSARAELRGHICTAVT